MGTPLLTPGYWMASRDEVIYVWPPDEFGVIRFRSMYRRYGIQPAAGQALKFRLTTRLSSIYQYPCLPGIIAFEHWPEELT